MRSRCRGWTGKGVKSRENDAHALGVCGRRFLVGLGDALRPPVASDGGVADLHVGAASGTKNRFRSGDAGGYGGQLNGQRLG
jgi:hypothetical protein